jgi:hypothetical protein
VYLIPGEELFFLIHFRYAHSRLPPTEETPRGNKEVVSGPGTTEPFGRGLPRAQKKSPAPDRRRINLRSGATGKHVFTL